MLLLEFFGQVTQLQKKYTNAKNILRSQFGWPDNFDKERWMMQKDDIWKQVMNRR